MATDVPLPVRLCDLHTLPLLQSSPTFFVTEQPKIGDYIRLVDSNPSTGWCLARITGTHGLIHFEEDYQGDPYSYRGYMVNTEIDPGSFRKWSNDK